jgi:hypothetical protein
VELSRDYGLKPADSIHAASAILLKVDELQQWDRDFEKVSDLVKVTEPKRITAQLDLLPELKKPIGPIPD